MYSLEYESQRYTQLGTPWSIQSLSQTSNLLLPGVHGHCDILNLALLGVYSHCDVLNLACDNVIHSAWYLLPGMYGLCVIHSTSYSLEYALNMTLPGEHSVCHCLWVCTTISRFKLSVRNSFSTLSSWHFLGINATSHSLRCTQNMALHLGIDTRLGTPFSQRGTPSLWSYSQLCAPRGCSYTHTQPCTQ